MNRPLDMTLSHATPGLAPAAGVNLSYVFGTQPAAVRHDPQIRRHRDRQPTNLREVAEILRGHPLDQAIPA